MNVIEKGMKLMKFMCKLGKKIELLNNYVRLCYNL